MHGSGAQNRESILPFARFLIRHGIAVLGYDKRGVGGSTGNWNTASFDDLADDVVAAFAYLKARGDIDGRQIGLLGVSQGGWIMPLAAVRAKDIAGGNLDYTLRILSKANHIHLEAKVGSNAEMASLQRFVPDYVPTIQDWLAKRIRGFRAPR